MKTNKQIYLMMENVGRELYQTINSLDQIVITKAEFDKCFSGVEIPTILNSFPILKKGVFIQKVDNFSDFLIFEVADIKDTGYKLYCKSFQVKNETDFPLWAYNVEAVVSLEDAEEIEVKFFNFTNAQTVVYTKQKRYSVADDFVSQYISRYTLNIWTFIKVMQWINYLSENPEIKVIEKKESNRNGNKKKVPKKSVSAADPRIVKINGIKIVSSNDRLVQKLNSKKRQRLTETWNVRGHYRHYKNGKKVYINPYTKGKKDGKTSRKSYHL